MGTDVELGAFLRNASASAEGLLLFGRTALGVESGDWPIPDPFSRRTLTSSMLSAGPRGAGLALHNHGEAFEAVMVGAKLWLFLPPLLASLEAPPEQVAARTRVQMMPPHELVALAEGDRAALLRAAGWDPAELRSCVARAGDAVLVPCNTYHATMNLGETTIAVGGQSADATGAGCPVDAMATAAAKTAAAARILQGAADTQQAEADLERAERLLREADAASPLNFENALLSSRGAFLRRRLRSRTGARGAEATEAAAAALRELWAAAMRWVASVQDGHARPEHAAAVLTAIGRHLLAEMRARVQRGDDEDGSEPGGWDDLSKLCWDVLRQAESLLHVLPPAGQRSVVVRAAVLLVAGARSEMLFLIGQSAAAAKAAHEVLRELRHLKARSGQDLSAAWRQALNSPPAEAPMSLGQLFAAMEAVVEARRHEL